MLKVNFRWWLSLRAKSLDQKPDVGTEGNQIRRPCRCHNGDGPKISLARYQTPGTIIALDSSMRRAVIGWSGEMLFGKHRTEPPRGGISFADGFVDGYHSILPDREPDRVPFRKIPLGALPYQCGFRTGSEQALLEQDTDTELEEDW